MVLKRQRIIKTLAATLSFAVGAGTVAGVPAECSDSDETCDAGEWRLVNVNGRFPTYGTKQYKDRCPWIYSELTTNEDSNPKCTFFVRPSPKSGEGLAQWVSQVVMGYIYAVQVGCRFVTDYGPSVEIETVFAPPTLLPDPIQQSWVVPRDFDCREEDECFDIGTYIGFIGPKRLRAWASRYYPDLASDTTKKFVRVPHYRMAYSRAENETDAIEALKDALPGFQYETGFACAMGRLFELPPSAADYMPGIFTDILRSIINPEAFVITIYIRTGRTDQVADLEKGKEITADVAETINSTSFDQNLIKCAQRVEKETYGVGIHSHIVWLIISDSPYVGKEVASLYNGRKEIKKGGRTIPRKVLTTSSQGIQTRPARDPSTSDFADAALDWFLIGESDAVISHGVTSFVTTGALRTARPLYTAMKGECKLRQPDNDGTAVIDGYVQASMRPGGTINLVQLLKDQRRAKKELEERAKMS